MLKQKIIISATLSLMLPGCALLDSGKVAPEPEPTREEIVENIKPKPRPTVKPKKPVVKAPEVPKTPTAKLGKKTAQGKLILGNKEWVYIEGVGISVETRIDTGASFSSASATNIVEFERDGKPWVKFNLAHDNLESREMTLPVHDIKKIRQSTTNKVESRYTVLGWIQVGDLKVQTPFTLVDRSHMEYGLLLGRSFFKDEAIVDISREFVQDKKE